MSDQSSKGTTTTSPASTKRAASGDIEEPKKKILSLGSGGMKLKGKNLLASKKAPPKGTLSISLKSKKVEKTETKLIPKAAAAFDDSDSEPEEMPVEARMRMRNIGRNTPTSAGPNSFNKGRLGFSDCQKSWQKQQLNLLDKIQKQPEEKK